MSHFVDPLPPLTCDVIYRWPLTHSYLRVDNYTVCFSAFILKNPEQIVKQLHAWRRYKCLLPSVNIWGASSEFYQYGDKLMALCYQVFAKLCNWHEIKQDISTILNSRKFEQSAFLGGHAIRPQCRLHWRTKCNLKLSLKTIQNSNSISKQKFFFIPPGETDL